MGEHRERAKRGVANMEGWDGSIWRPESTHGGPTSTHLGVPYDMFQHMGVPYDMLQHMGVPYDMLQHMGVPVQHMGGPV